MAREARIPAADIIAALEGLAVPELDSVIAAAQRQRDTRRETGKQELLQEIQAKAEALGLTIDELLGRAAPKTRAPRKPPRGDDRRGAPRGPVAAKYRNPETGETWSGRGRAPRWLTAAEAQGRQREEFAVAVRG